MSLETKLGLGISLAIITFAFLVLTLSHLINYLRPRLAHIERPKGVITKWNSVSTGFVEFADEVNRFVDDLNTTHKRANKVGAIGYGLSFAATLVSLIILLYTKF